MKSKKVIDGIRSVLHNEGLDAHRNYGFMGKSREIWHGFRQGFARAIYNNRKEIGLFTLDDIEIDEDKVLSIIYKATDDYIDNAYEDDGVDPYVAKAIADKRPIKIKE